MHMTVLPQLETHRAEIYRVAAMTALVGGPVQLLSEFCQNEPEFPLIVAVYAVHCVLSRRSRLLVTDAASIVRPGRRP